MSNLNEYVTVLANENATLKNQVGELASSVQRLMATLKDMQEENVESRDMSLKSPDIGGNLVAFSKPRKFSKRRKEFPVDRFIFQFTNRWTNENDTLKISVVASYLEEDAAIWWQARFNDAVEENWTYKKFCDELSKAFPDLNASRNARLELDNLRQKGSVQTYAATYRSILMRIPDMSEADKVYNFVKHLKGNVKAKVLIENPENLEDAIAIADRVDSIHWNMHGSYDNNRGSYNNRPNNNSDGAEKMDLSNIGRYPDVYRRKNRDVSNDICRKCKRKGHWARDCKNPTLSAVVEEKIRFVEETLTKPDEVAEEKLTINAKRDLERDDLLELGMRINNSFCKVLIDSGCQKNVISREFSAKAGLMADESDCITVVYANGTSGKSDGIVRDVAVHEKSSNYVDRIDFQVVEGLAHEAILGKTWLAKRNPSIDWNRNCILLNGRWVKSLSRSGSFGKISSVTEINKLAKSNNNQIFLIHIQKTKVGDDIEKNLSRKAICKLENENPLYVTEKEPARPSNNYENELKNLINDYEDVFPDELPNELPPKRAVDHEIELKTDARPVSISPYRLAPVELEELKKQLNELLEKGLIRPSKSPWGAPVLFVKKKDGSKRLCIDYRALNKMTIKNGYPLPRIDDILDRVSGSKYFSSIDLRSAYHQIRVAENDIPKTAFRTRYGHYEFCVLPFGLCNAPATFQTLIDSILSDLIDQGVIVYLDDILIYTKTEEEHLRILTEVLQRLREHKLYGKLSKSEFMKSEIEYLGHVLSSEGVRPTEEKVKSISNWPTPTNQKEVMQFLGLCNYYRIFINDFAKITYPLTELLSKRKEFHWNDLCDRAFRRIKEAMTNYPILKIFDPKKEVRLVTDASNFAIGGCLLQKHGTNWYPVAYRSRKLNAAEKNYPVHERELLAFIDCLKNWRHYVYGCELINAYTDHKPLLYLFSQKDLSGRQARWITLLADYNVTFNYLEGRHNILADALSRRPDYELNVVALVHEESTELLNEIKDGYATDEFFSSIISYFRGEEVVDKSVLSTFKWYEYNVEEGLLYYVRDGSKRLCIPKKKNLLARLLHEYHEAPTFGHPGTFKMYLILRKHYFWPKMLETIKSYCTRCPTCQRCKPRRHSSNGVLQPIELPDYPWSDISLDFITGLPMTENGFNSILNVVDRFTKSVVFIPTVDTITSTGTADIMFDSVVCYYGYPKSIVSDRDPKFTARVWKRLWERSGTKLKMSTSNHPQTDGQTEVVNQQLETMLRMYCAAKKEHWDEYLSVLQMAFNNNVQISTGYSPFYLNFGREMRLPTSVIHIGESIDQNVTNPDFVEKLEAAWKDCLDAITLAQTRQAKYANEDRRIEKFNIGDLVLLKADQIGTVVDRKRRLSKLDERYLGPFEICEVVSDSAYKLILPDTLNIWPVFHVSVLERYLKPDSDFGQQYAEVPLPELKDEVEYYQLERILNHRVRRGRYEYLVKWKDYPLSESTWEPEARLLEDAEDHVIDYRNRKSIKSCDLVGECDVTRFAPLH